MNDKINAPKLKVLTAVLAMILMVLPAFPVYSATGTNTTETTSTQTANSQPANLESPEKPKSPTVPNPELIAPPDSTSPATTDTTNTNPTPTTSTDTSKSAGTNDTSATNTNTGTASENKAVVGQTNGTNITNNNDADVKNSLDANANSGDNEASYNTGNADISTGDANLTLSILNLINSIFAGVDGGQMNFLFKNIYGDLNGNYIIDPLSGEAYSLTGARISAENLGTGAGSTNSALVNSNNGTNITNNNNANVGNDLNLTANTGGNSANFNTGTGTIKTGDANVALNLVNFINSSFVVTEQGLFLILNVFGDWLGNLLVPKSMLSASGGTSGAVIVNNTNTGAVSVNSAGVNSSNNTNINNNNTGNITNGIDLNANTGGNETSYNTKGGSIATGAANTLLNLKNFANQNIVGNFALLLVNVLGTWSGKNLLPGMTTITSNSDPNLVAAGNGSTGTGSENTALVNSSNGTSITNNNNGTLNNRINITANTGNNSASYNTGSGLISTGNANILANILNFMNMNVVSGKGLYVIVNVFGDWTGNIDTLKETAGSKAAGKVLLALTPKAKNSSNHYYVTANGKQIAGVNAAMSESTNGGNNNQNVLAGSGSNSDLTKNAESNNSNYSPIEFVKAYLKIVLPILVVSYVAFIALYYRKKSRQS